MTKMSLPRSLILLGMILRQRRPPLSKNSTVLSFLPAASRKA